MCLLPRLCKLVLTQYSALITYELYYTAVAVTGSIYSIIKQLLYIDVECDYCVAANLANAGNLHTCILHCNNVNNSVNKRSLFEQRRRTYNEAITETYTN